MTEIVKIAGASIPALGLGTWELRGDTAETLVAHALGVGYRHIDTAQMYRNEAAVGAGIRRSGVARSEIFLTTKIWPDRFADGELQRAAEDSLKALQVDEVDLLLLHWPNADVTLEETLGALNEVRARGLTRHIGVSNFNRELVDRAVAVSAAPIVVNQVEYHPYLSQRKLLDKLAEHDIALTAYSPIARGRVLDDDTLRDIAAAHRKNPVQVTLRWLLQQPRVCAIPRSQNESRVSENFELFDFELSSDEMTAIAALAEPGGRIVDMENLAPDWD